MPICNHQSKIFYNKVQTLDKPSLMACHLYLTCQFSGGLQTLEEGHLRTVPAWMGPWPHLWGRTAKRLLKTSPAIRHGESRTNGKQLWLKRYSKSKLILQCQKKKIQLGPVIPRFVKSRVRLSRGRMMDLRLLDWNVLGLQTAMSHCKQKWQDLRIQTLKID